MANQRPTRAVVGGQSVGLFVVLAAAVALAPTANWDLGLFAILLGFAVFSDLTAKAVGDSIKISGSFLALVLSMVFLGGSPACADRADRRDHGLAALARSDALLHPQPPQLLALLAGRRPRLPRGDDDQRHHRLRHRLLRPRLRRLPARLAINFTLLASYIRYVEGTPFLAQVRKALVPLLPSELMAALMAVGVAFLYAEVGIAAVALFGVVLITFQYLLGALLVSQQRAEELEKRSNQLASFQVGMLSALLRTLDLRDQMTARHSAAVARYSRAIAQRAGFSRQEEELVHIAALLHDIGKFILPDRILKANVPLTDEDWMLIKRHPQQGARVVSSLDGYGPVADIILAHHERIDGKGYPRGLKGDEIPELARIISVSDTYDVMTARDSYRTPMSSYDAIVELRRVAGKQLDARFVEIFIELLEGKDVSFQHGEAADFEKELALESRIAETASPDGESSRFQVAGVQPSQPSPRRPRIGWRACGR